MTGIGRRCEDCAGQSVFRRSTERVLVSRLGEGQELEGMHGGSSLAHVAAGGLVVLGGQIARADDTSLSPSLAMIIRQQADTAAHALASQRRPRPPRGLSGRGVRTRIAHDTRLGSSG